MMRPTLSVDVGEMIMNGFDAWELSFYHSGIKGQKWGIRRYQNPDGSLTPEGRARYLKNGSNELNFRGRIAVRHLQRSGNVNKRLAADKLLTSLGQRREKDIVGAMKAKLNRRSDFNKEARSMSSEELQSAISKLRLEREYASLKSEQNKSILSKGAEVVGRALENVATDALTNILGSSINAIAGRQVTNRTIGEKRNQYMEELKSAVDRASLEAKYRALTNTASKSSEATSKESKATVSKSSKKTSDYKVHIPKANKIEKASLFERKYAAGTHNLSKSKADVIEIANNILTNDVAIEKLRKAGYKWGKYAPK